MPYPIVDKYSFLLLITSALLLFTGFANDRSEREQHPPNIIIIHVDDLGWADLSVQGSTFYETPHIDGLASNGVRFTDAYASASVCSPTRAALMTGRYPARVGITDWIRAEFQGGEIPEDGQNPTEYEGGPDQPLLTPPNPLWMEHEEVTIADILKQAGYKNVHIGKWHLGGENWYPETQGFHINIGGADLGEPPSFFDPYYSERVGFIPTLEPREEGEYLTDREAWEAVNFIEHHHDRPFFMHFANYAVHTPIQAKEELIERYENKPPTFQDNPVYAGMVHSVDEAVGAIIQKLKELDIYENTFIIFTSDNGGLDRQDATTNDPFRSGKGYPYDGGIRVPFIASWPGVVEPAGVSYEPVKSIDIMPTVLDAAGVSLPDGLIIDGVSLWGHLLSGGEESLGRNELIWHFPHYRQGRNVTPYSIIRSGHWKLIKWWEGPEFELYNLFDDIGETMNLADEHPEKTEDLNTRLLEILEETGAKLPKINPDYEGTD
jgi:arylsulfatase A